MIAVLFPGQGSERAGIGLDVFQRYPRAKDLVQRASRATGIDALRELARPSRDLRRTEVLQPILVAICLDQARKKPGGMVALSTRDFTDIERALRAGRNAGALDLAAHNSPDEWVLAGDEDALRAALSVIPGVRLSVSGAWHSANMTPAGDSLRAAWTLNPETNSLRCELVPNVTGRLERDTSVIRDAMCDAISKPVQWVQTLRTLEAAGAREYLVVGPGKTVRASIRRTLGAETTVWLAEDVPSLERVKSAIGKSHAS